MRHDVLVTVGADGHPWSEWHFADERRHSVLTLEPMMAINDGPALVNAAIAGQGVVHLPTINFERRVLRGRLLRLLPQCYSEAPALTLVFPAAVQRLPKVRVFTEFLGALLQDIGSGTVRPPAAHRPRKWPARLGVRREQS